MGWQLDRLMKNYANNNFISARTCRDSEGRDYFLLSDPVINKKLRVTPKVFEIFISTLGRTDEELEPVEEQVLEILRGELFSSKDMDLNKRENLRIWYARSWKRSLEYFYSTRINGYSDSFVAYREAQLLAVENYSKQSPIPLPERKRQNIIKLAQKIDPKLNEFGDVLLNRKCSEKPKKGLADFQMLSSVLQLSTQKFHETWNPPISDPEKIYQSLGSCFDFYIVNYSTAGLDTGVYKYHPDILSIEKTNLNISRGEMYEILIGHDAPLVASFSILMVANFDRAMWRYRHDRALRNIYVEAGRICQYFILSLTAYKLNTHITPAVVDKLAAKLLAIEKSKQQLMYTISAG